MNDKVKNYIEEKHKRYQAQHGERQLFYNLLQEVLDVFDPNYTDIVANPFTNSTGKRGDRRIFDSSGIQGVEIFSNALNSMLYSPFQPFFQFSYADHKAVDQNRRLAEWLTEIDQDLQETIQQSNFHSERTEATNDYVVAGEETLNVFTYDFGHPQYGDPIFQTLPFDQMTYQEGIDGEVDTHWRKFVLPAHMLGLYPEFQETIEKDDWLKNKVNKEPDDKISIIHYAAPKREGDVTFLRMHEYVSLYYVEDKKIPLNLKGGLLNGYEEQAVFTNRYRVKAGEINPRSSTMGVLGDAQSLQVLAKMRLKLVAKAVDPPYGYNPKKVMEQVQLVAGGGTPMKDPNALWFYEQTGRLDSAYAEHSHLSENVMNGFHKNDFRFPENLPQMTATEARVRSQLMQGQLSPMIARSTKYVSKIIQRVFWQRYRAGKYDPPPVALDPLRLNVQIISPLAKAQKANDVMQLQEFMRFLDEQGQLDPRMSRKMDKDRAIEWMADNTNTAFRQFMRPKEEIDQEMQEEQLLSAIPDAASALKDASQATLNSAKASAL